MYVCVCVFVCVCVPLRLLLTSGVIGVIQTLYDWLNKLYGFCIAVVVGIVSARDLSIHTRCGNEPSKSKLALSIIA